jgi:3-hydroxyisobutyrate dehydrogenase
MNGERLNIGFVGIGRMGWPMARNIAAAGFPTHVYDADPVRARRFEAECGGRAAESLEALGRAADLVVTMLPTGKDVSEAVLGSQAVRTGTSVASDDREAVSDDVSAISDDSHAVNDGDSHAVNDGARAERDLTALASTLRRGAVVVDMSSPTRSARASSAPRFARAASR